MDDPKGVIKSTDSYVDLSFRHPENWKNLMEMATLPGEGMEALFNLHFNAIVLGDQQSGPLISLVCCAPGVDLPMGPAHSHASDNFRISLLGEFKMGPETYGPGEFRLQKGLKPYPGDNNSCGPEGGWQLVTFLDRRGTRARWVQKEVPNVDFDGDIEKTQQSLWNYFGINHGDIFSDEPKDAAGPSAFASTLGTANSGKLNGSFANQEAWQEVGPSTRAAVTLLGEPVVGPVLILSTTEAFQVAMPQTRFETEVFRMVVAGSCDIDGQIYEYGDIRIQRPGAACGPVVAGPNGLQEVLILGDRRHAVPTVENNEMWPATLGAIVDDLQGVLSAQSST